MKAAIERRGGEILSRDYFAAWLGFRELGYEVRFYEQGNVAVLPPDPDLVVVGGIASVWAALERLGVPRPEVPAIPAELVPFAGRRLWSMTLGGVGRWSLPRCRLTGG